MFPSIDLLITIPSEGLAKEQVKAITISSRRSGWEPWLIAQGEGEAARRLLAITNCKTEYVAEIRYNDSIGLGSMFYMQNTLAERKELVGVSSVSRVLVPDELGFYYKTRPDSTALSLTNALKTPQEFSSPVMFRREVIQESCFLGMEAGDTFSYSITLLGGLVQGEVAVDARAFFTRTDSRLSPYTKESLASISEIVNNCTACQKRLKNGR